MNRFSNDFTTTSSVYATNSNPQHSHHPNNNNASTTLGTAITDKRLRDIGDLHSVSVSIEHGHDVEDDEEENDKHHQYAREYQTIATIPSEAIAKTMYVSTTDLLPDDDDEFRVSKPLLHQSDSTNRSHGFESESLTIIRASTQPDRDRHRNVPQHAVISKGTSKCCTTAEYETSRVQTSSENVSRSAHIQFDLKSSESCGSSSSGITSCESIVNVAEGVEKMRLNVPAAVDGTQHEGGGHTSAAGRLLNKNNNAPMPTVTARVLENGTLMGSIVTTQPSLTIHVNQSDHNSQQQQDVVNQSSGVSIVNCYRAVPVHIVNSVSYSNVNNNGDSDASTMHVVNNSNSKKCDNTKSKINDLEIIQVINEPMDNQRNIGINSVHHQQQQRTFTSTEAQTDDLQHFPQHRREESDITTACISSVSLSDPATSYPLFLSQAPIQDNQTTDNSIPLNVSREQRRRDRRERRQARNSRQQHVHPVPMPIRSGFEILPDILNSHVPPPYTALSLATAAVAPPSTTVLVPPINNALPIVGGIAADDERYTFPLPIIRR